MEAPIYQLRRYHLLVLLCIGNIIGMMLRHATTFTLIAMGNMSSADMAQVESAYFYGYCIGTAPAGFIADAIGARFLITVAIGGSGFFALFTQARVFFYKWLINVQSYTFFGFLRPISNCASFKILIFKIE